MHKNLFTLILFQDYQINFYFEQIWQDRRLAYDSVLNDTESITLPHSWWDNLLWYHFECKYIPFPSYYYAKQQSINSVVQDVNGVHRMQRKLYCSVHSRHVMYVLFLLYRESACHYFQSLFRDYKWQYCFACINLYPFSLDLVKLSQQQIISVSGSWICMPFKFHFCVPHTFKWCDLPNVWFKFSFSNWYVTTLLNVP